MFAKRVVSFILVGFCSLFVLSALNMQKVYTIRDTVYRRVDALCLRSGVIGPSSFSPMNEASLIMALDRIDVNALSSADRKEFLELHDLLTGNKYLVKQDDFSLDGYIGVNLGIYIADYSDFDFTNANKKQPYFDRREDILLPYRYSMPGLTVGGNFNFGDNVALEVEFDFGNLNRRLYETSFGWIFTTLEDVGLGLNFTPEIPVRAGGSFGNEYVSFIIGRFPHSMGNGITGNLTVGDNFVYQEIANLSFLSNIFTYNISFTRFDQQIGCIENEDGTVPSVEDDHLTTFSHNKFSGMQQYRVVHRFDINILDRARFILIFSTLYNSSNSFDLRFFSPFVIAHNYYNYDSTVNKTYFDEANNLIGLEFECNIVKGLRLSLQAVIDQMQMFFEPDDFPPAYGLLGNMRYSANVNSSVVELWLEGAYTNPYLYLNEKRNSDGALDYNLDYVVGYHRLRDVEDYGYSGYIYGPDTIAIALGGKYLRHELDLEIGGNILYRIRGEKAIRHQGSVIDMSNSHLLEGNAFSNAITPSGGWKNAEQLLKLACYGIYHIEKQEWGKISFYLASGFNTYFNYERVQGRVKFQPQIMFGSIYMY